ncbi:uncharacterized protein, partial [Eucyclogobius newberryi]|uniref:uncharacterized protein n=1 Tax=Eucyclogobius newberryi TaxID=166745 RepID=UPI003B597337
MALRRRTLQLFRWTSLLLLSTALWTVDSVDESPCPRSCSCPALREVHCTFRHLSALPKTFPRDTQRLNLGYNSLTEVEGSEVRSLRQLEMLMLHGNDIETIHDGAFYGLRALQILKLSYNKLRSVRRALFEGLTGLVRLHLDHNLISFIEPYSFSGLTSLKLLQLEGNLLREIHPHSFITVSVLGHFWTSGLKHLHLSENLLERLPSSCLSSAPRLELLSLHSNPWICDCGLSWLLHWGAEHQGVVKCKKDRDSGFAEVCPQCFSPQPLNGSNLLDLTPEQLTCQRPSLKSPLKLWDNPLWSDSEPEPDVPYTRDFEKPLGQLTFVLSDSHSNHAHVACDVRQPAEPTPISWSTNSQTPDDVSVNVTLATTLECEIDRESLQNLWQLVAYYYQSPAILERGQRRGNTSTVTYQYVQVINENSPYFTELKGYLSAGPSWLLQPRVTLTLNRPQTTTKKLAMDFTTVITKNLNSYTGQEEDSDITSSWAMIRQGGSGRVQTALKGSKVTLECDVVASEPLTKVEWMLPDMSILENSNDKIEIPSNSELVILNATLSDSGVYHCMVRTHAGVDLVPFRVTIKETSLSPKVLNGEKLELEKGDSFTLPCHVTSVQPSQTLWYLPKNQVLLPTQQTKRAQVMDNGTLVVKRLTPEDAGEYSCLASNLHGVDMIAHMVEVKTEKPKARIQDENVQTLLTNLDEGGEGSGRDFQEIIRPFATQFPKKVMLQQRNQNLKRIRGKDSKRKPNKSIKELDPSRWAEILAKANAKTTVASSTQKLATRRITTTMASTVFSRQLDEDSADVKVESIAPVMQIPLLQTETEPSTAKTENSPEKLATAAASPVTDKVYSDERRNSSLFPNRRRPFGRRRPGRPRVRPNHSNRPTTPTTTTTTTAPTTTTITTTTTTTTTTAPTTTTTTTTTTTAPTTIASTTDPSAEYTFEEDEGEYYDEDIAISTTQEMEITPTQWPKIFTIPTHRAEEKVYQSRWATPTYSTRDSVRLTTQFRHPAEVKPLPKLVPILPHEPRTPSRVVPDSKMVTERVVKLPEKPKSKPNTDDFPMPVHPWLYRPNHGGGETSNVNDNKERSNGKAVEVKPVRPNQSPHVPPTAHWQRPQPGPVYPTWPKTYSKPGSNLVPTPRPWPFQHPWVQAPFTNRPEITAETVRPTASPTGHSGFNHHYYNPPAQRPNQPTMDQLLITRLRNRYRQAQLDRMAQLGKIVTPRPRLSYSKVPFGLTPRPFFPHKPYKYSPTTSYSHTPPPPHNRKSYPVFYPSPWPKYPSPHGPQHGAHWPIGGGRVSSRRVTVAPPFPWAVGGDSGSKPRITSVSVASVAALAESDVLLPCNAAGRPAPTIAWTKVSTGSTIPAGSRHGSRFEVFLNGSFLVRSVQLQDRGQYLCTAQNRFGSDRSVITLAVQTRPPTIQPATPTQVSLYLGQTATLHCSASGRPAPQVSWILPDRTFVRDVGAMYTPLAPIVLFSNGTLQIHSANFSSKGDYKCIASNAAGADTVTYHVHVAALPPAIGEKGMDTVVIQP